MSDPGTNEPKLKGTWMMVRAFLAAEALKLRRSRMAKTALIGMCVTPPSLIGIVWGMETSFQVFPQVLQAISASLWLLTGLTALLLTADLVANEFERGTARVVLGRGTPRWLFVVGKGVVLLAATAVNALATWFCGGLAAILSHLAHAGTEGLGEGIVALFTSGLPAVGVVVLAGAAYISLTTVIGLLTRSPAFTMLGGLGLFIGDFLLGEFSFVPAWQEVELGAFSILSNTNALLNQLPEAQGITWMLQEGPAVSPSTALFVLACYIIGGMVVACALFQRQDVLNK